MRIRSFSSGILVASLLLTPAFLSSQADSQVRQITQKQATAKKAIRVFGKPLRGHPGGVTSVTFSSDGKWLVSAGADGDVATWSAKSGKRKKQLAAHEGYVHLAAFYDEDKKIVSVGSDRTIAFHDAKSGALLGRIADLPEKLKGTLQYLCWQLTPDRTELLLEDPTRRATGILRVDLANRKLVDPLALPGPAIKKFALASDSRLLGLVERGPSFGQVLHVYDLQSKQTVFRGDKVPYADRLFFSADNTKLFLCSADVWQTWDVKTGKLIDERKSEIGQMRGSALSSDGNVLFAGSSVGGKLIGYDFQAASPLFEWTGFTHQVLGVALSPDQKTVAAGCMDGSLRLFSAKTGKERFASKGHGARIASVALSKDGQQMITGCHDGSVLLWQPSRKQPTARLRPTSAPIVLVGNTATGKPYAVAGDMTCKLLDPKSGKATKTLKLGKDAPNAMGVLATTDGKRLIVSDYVESGEEVSGKHHVWNLVTGKRTATHATPAVFHAYSFANNGKHMAVMNEDRMAIRMVGKPDPVFVFEPQQYGYYGMAMLGNDRAITGNLDGELVLWQSGTAALAKKVALPEGSGVVASLLVSADSQRIFAAVSHAIVIYDAELNLMAHLTKLDATPVSMAVSQDGNTLLCGMTDSTACMWSLNKLMK